MNRIGIVLNQNHPEAKAVLEKLTCRLSEQHKKVVILDHFAKYTRFSLDLVIVLGGDGTLLSVARWVAPSAIPILAVNLGSLGFLTEVTLAELNSNLDQIFQGAYCEDPRMMLQCQIQRGKKRIAQSIALNDIAINKGAFPKLIQLEVTVDRQFVTALRGDGLIISSATGSTGYALSMGGPIIHPSVEAILLTPLCPHTLTHRPIVVPASAEVQVVFKSQEAGPTACLDGQELFPLQTGDRICIKAAERRLKLIQSPHRDYYNLLREKLQWGTQSVR